MSERSINLGAPVGRVKVLVIQSRWQVSLLRMTAAGIKAVAPSVEHCEVCLVGLDICDCQDWYDAVESRLS